MPSVNFSFPVKTTSHSITIVNCLNKLLTWRNNTITKESRNTLLGFPILLIFYDDKIRGVSFHQKEAVLSESQLTDLSRASTGKGFYRETMHLHGAGEN